MSCKTKLDAGSVIVERMISIDLTLPSQDPRRSSSIAPLRRIVKGSPNAPALNVPVNPCPAQLKLGLKLYTSHLPRLSAWLHRRSSGLKHSLARMRCANPPRKGPRLLQVRLLRLQPDHVGVRRELDRTANGRLDAATEVVVAFAGARGWVGIK